MKTKLFMIISFALILCAPILKAQSAWTANYPKKTIIMGENSAPTAMAIILKGKIDTTTKASVELTADTSQAFNVSQFNDSTCNPYFESILTGGTASTRKITFELWGAPYETGTYNLIKTIYTADSVNTLHRAAFGFAGFPHPWVKFVVKKAAGNITTTFEIDVVLPRKKLQ